MELKNGIDQEIKRENPINKLKQENDNKTSKNLKEILNASYQNQKEATKTLNNLKYNYDKGLSTNESKVFVDKRGNPTIAFRGSKTLKDFVISDSLLLVGLEKYDKRFLQSNRLLKKVEEKYKRPVNVIGHSLGGSIAESTNKINSKNKIYAVNKGVGLSGIFKTIPKNQTDLRKSNDLISILSLTQKNKGKKKTTINLFESALSAHKYDYL
jgi:hypothetical protein